MKYRVSLCYSFEVEAEDRFEAVQKALAAMLADRGHALAKMVVSGYYVAEDFFNIKARPVRGGRDES